MKLSIHQSKGFTLLEMVVVVAILGLVTSIVTDFTVFNNSQKLYEVTKNKLYGVKEIRHGVIGLPGNTINSEINISGFIADTGTIPQHLVALMLPAYCSDPKYLRNQGSCSATWYSPDGWRGPYLQGFETEKGVFDLGTPSTADDIEVRYSTYRDGWGNKASSWYEDGDANADNDHDNKLARDILNSGWVFVWNGDDLIINSVGLNRVLDPGFNTDLSNLSSMTATTAQKNSYYSLERDERDFPLTVYKDDGSIPWELEIPKLIVESDYKNGQSLYFNVEVKGIDTAAAYKICVMYRKPGLGLNTIDIIDPAISTDQTVITSGLSSLIHGVYSIELYEVDGSSADCNTLNDEIVPFGGKPYFTIQSTPMVSPIELSLSLL